MQFLIDFVSSIFAYIKAIFKAIPDFYDSLRETLFSLFSHFLQTVLDVLLYVPRMIYSYLTDFAFFIFGTCNTCGVNYIFRTILDGLTSFHSLSSSSYSGFDFAACISLISDILSLNAGFQLLVCAFLFRFALRRLPLFG